MPSKTTILEVLSQPNPQIDASQSRRGTNSNSSPYWPDVDNWSRWEDFNARDLYDLYRGVVDADWPSDAVGSPEPSRWDARVFDEDSLGHYLSRFMLPQVNAALCHAGRVLGITKDYDLHIGRSGRCSYEAIADSRFKPDWSLCCDAQTLDKGVYLNLLPGHSKLSKRWRSDMHAKASHHKWKDPVRQMLHHIAELHVRYGWLLTDTELVVIRVSAQLTGARQATNRLRRRPPPLGRDRTTSVGSAISRLSSAMQGMSLGGSSSYRPPGGGIDAFRVEYQTIAWKEHGNGRSRLSIRLALFYLAMMAGFGHRSLLTGYPAFDSWWWCVDDDCSFVHNTTGMPSKKRPRALEYPDPNGQRGPEWVSFTSSDGVSEDYLTRTSARTLDVDPERQQHYFSLSQPDEHGNEISRTFFVDEDMLLFDLDAAQYGRFKGLVWVVEAAEQESPRREKRRHRRKGARTYRYGKRPKK